jgi:uncharacterized repeat protein (TIGR02543 family)
MNSRKQRNRLIAANPICIGQILLFLVIGALFNLVGCSNLIVELGEKELFSGVNVVLPVSNGDAVTAVVVTGAESGSDGLDLDGDGIADINFVTADSLSAIGRYALDVSKDGTTDVYLLVSATATSTLNTMQDGQGSSASLIVDALGLVIDVDISGDSGTSIPVSLTSLFLVTYNANGSTAGSVPIDDTSYASGASVTVLGNTGSVVKTGHGFAGWNTAADGSATDYADGASFTMAEANVTIYAKWILNSSYSITFDNNDAGATGTMEAQAITSGLSANLTANAFSKTGYAFAGWNTADDGSGTDYADGVSFTMGGANITLYAKWTLNPSYSITFDNNDAGATGTMGLQAITSGLSANLTANAFSKTGYAFDGWNIADDGSGTDYADGVSFTMGVANITLYAKWALNPSYSITFDNNDAGATGTMGVQAITSGLSANLTANAFSKTGYAFAGWNTADDGSGTDYANGASYTMASADITLYALWDSLVASHTLSSGNVLDITAGSAWVYTYVDFKLGTIAFNSAYDTASENTILLLSGSNPSNGGTLRINTTIDVQTVTISSEVQTVIAGTTIDSSTGWTGGSTAEISGNFQNWGDKSNVYIPLKLKVDGSSLYGYMEVSFIDATGTLTIHTLAYSKIAGYAIAAGATAP